jgi:peroxiredoxin
VCARSRIRAFAGDLRIAMEEDTPMKKTVLKPRARKTASRALAAGTKAPEFELHSTPDQLVPLSDFRGRPVILAFYPADWSPVCGDQMALYNEILEEFEAHDAELLGISVDGPWCHAAFARDRKLHFPLLADFEPKGAVARRYGVYRDAEGISERALFVIDANGVIRWIYVSPVGVNPGADGILKAVQQAFGKRLRFVFRNFPLRQAHVHAEGAAEAAEAAGAQGKFWEMHDALYEHQDALELDDLVAYARTLGLDVERFTAELEKRVHAPRVREDFQSGIKSGVNGTPTFFINGARLDGSWDVVGLTTAIEEALAK